MLDAEGYPNVKGALKKVAAFADVHPNVLRRWYRGAQNPAPTELVTRKKGELVDLLRNEAHAILREMELSREETDYRSLGTVLGIVIDKLQLLEGKPTERSEQNVTHDVSGEIKQAVLSRLSGIAAANATGTGDREPDA